MWLERLVGAVGRSGPSVTRSSRSRLPSRRIRLGLLGCLGVTLSSRVGRAHEEYVTDEHESEPLRAFYRDALSDPMVVGPLLIGALVILVGVLTFLYARPFRRDVASFRVAMSEYREFVPWLLRISLGIPLVGAGFSGYFISPAVDVQLRLLQVFLGFMLLFGLFTRLVAVAVLVIYLVGAIVEPQLLLQFEVVGAAVAIAVVGGGQPSADHVLGRLAETSGTLLNRLNPAAAPGELLEPWTETASRYLPTICRAGLGVAFVYLGVTQKLLDPALALAVVEKYELTAAVPVPAALWVLAAGLTETVLGLALLAGIFTRGVAVAALFVFTATLFALPDDPVLAHVSLFGLASVLLITGGGPWSFDKWAAHGHPTVEVPQADAAD